MPDGLVRDLCGAFDQPDSHLPTHNYEAYELYLRGRYFWFKFPAKEFEKSRVYFRRAADVDPDYALAHAGLADKEQAFAWLAKAGRERNGLIYAVKTDPIYDPLRADPRFLDILNSVRPE